MTLSKISWKILSITSVSKVKLTIMTLSKNIMENTQHKDSSKNETQHKDTHGNVQHKNTHKDNTQHKD